jgi:hypothetical protein
MTKKSGEEDIRINSNQVGGERRIRQLRNKYRKEPA